MSSKRLLTTLGFAGLTVTLVALPGSSAQDPKPSVAKAWEWAQEQSAQDAENRIRDMQQAVEDLDVSPLVTTDGDDDVQVIAHSGQSWVGVGIAEVNADKVKELKLPAERGVVVSKVVPESPAGKAGLKENDVVTEINGQRVEGTEQFRRMIREIPAGRTAQLTIWRDGRTQTIALTVAKSEARRTMSAFVAPATPGGFAFQMPEVAPLGDLFVNGQWMAAGPRLGIDAENLDGDFGNYFGAPDGEGILVRGVFADSAAAKAGLKVGDVITTLDGERIRSIGELREKLTEKKAGKAVKLGLLRNKAPLTLTIELPAPPEKRTFHNSERTAI